MFARPLPLLAVGLLGGSFAGTILEYLPLTILLVALVVLGFLAIAASRAWCSRIFACLTFGFFLFGLASAALVYSHAHQSIVHPHLQSEKLEFLAEVVEPVRYGQDRAVLTIRLSRLYGPTAEVPISGRMRLTVRGPVPQLVIGDLIRFRSRVRPPHGLLNPGMFDHEEYLYLHGVQAVGSLTLGADGSGMEIIAHIPHPIRDRIDAWRGQIRETARRSLQPDAAALYLALITGETGYLSREIRDSFMAAGVTHILSISGSHLGLIGAVVFWLARRSILALPPPWLLRLTLRATPTRLAAAFTIPCVLFYAILGGAEVATIRSLLMLGVFFGAVLLGREVHVGTGLAFAALLIVLWDPLAPLDLSFQLSFLSVLTILLLLLYRRRDSSIPEHVPFKSVAKRAGEQVLEVLLIGAAVTVMTLPLIATHFHQIQWVGLLSNLIIIPLVGIFIVPLGLVGCLATLLSSGDGLQGASILQLVLDALLWIVRSCARLPGAHWMVASPPLWQVLLFYGCLVSTLFRRDRWFAYVTGSLAVVLVALWIWSPRQLPPEGTTRVTFLDVGQGDAAVIEAPNGRVMLIDGGGASDWSDQGRAVIAPYLWNRGIRRLDLVIATHPQLDHIGGLVYIAEEFRIAQFWNNGVARDISFMQRLNEILTSRQVPIKAVSSAEAPLSWGGCTIAILNPFPTSAHTSSPRIYDGRDLNNTSLVLRLACRETSILFTADIEQDAEARLIGTGVIEGTVLKVPHHGSAGSLHQPFLEAVRPKLAIVSVGLGNPYRHPSLKMLETYERMNINVLRTDRDGAVTILASKADVQVGCEAARRLKRIRPGSAHIALEEWSNLRRLGVSLAPCRSA